MGFKDFLKNVTTQADEIRKKYAPKMLSPEKRYARGIVSVCALLAMADGELEESEVEAASQFLMGVNEIQQYFGESDALELFSQLVNDLQTESTKGRAFSKMQINKMIAELKETVTRQDWRSNIMLIAKEMAGANHAGKPGAHEQNIISQLEAAIGA
uniref:Tellurite resistance protein TerB n=1 Tax=Candidatus Kentrum sp. MB TaxID=2138164 RepID=A0A451B8A8_9GAMM|nr:MAG: Tellurite resistance protein TerB [Candidatus Kentron sp. MB]VFK26637.1 MAG: Tellurite resistance protein TerB [Candidatus Kentron sp. MB]VFK74516.1 MAG: Tellurite resistance protein TerB [Candidatus Kentron sp. MB]